MSWRQSLWTYGHANMGTRNYKSTCWEPDQTFWRTSPLTSECYRLTARSLRISRSQLRRHSSHECTHDLAAKELPSLINVVNSRRLDLNVLEASRRELGAIFVFFEGARNAANPQKHTFANLRRNLATSH